MFVFSKRIGESSGEDDTLAIETARQLKTQPSHAIQANCDGYLQAIDEATLIESAREHDWIVQLQVRPGDFLMLGDPVARLWGRRGEVDKAAGLINGTLIVGSTRTSRRWREDAAEGGPGDRQIPCVADRENDARRGSSPRGFGANLRAR